MRELAKDERAENPWKSAEEPSPRPPPRREKPPHPPGPLLGAGGAPAVGGDLFHGLYDGGVDASRSSSKLIPPSPAVKPGYLDVNKPEVGKEQEPLTGVADERLQKLKEIAKKAAGVQVGIPGAVETTTGHLMGGAAAGALAGSSNPAKEPPPVPAPRLTEGEQAAAAKDFEARIKKENLVNGIKELMDKRKRKEAEGQEKK